MAAMSQMEDLPSVAGRASDAPAPGPSSSFMPKSTLNLPPSVKCSGQAGTVAPAPGSAAWAQEASQDLRFKDFLRRFEKHEYLQSESIIEGLVQEYPQSGMYWFNLGNTQFLMEKYSLAISSYNKVVNLRSALWVPAKLYIAKSYLKMHQIQNAEKILTPILEMQLPVHLHEEIVFEMIAIHCFSGARLYLLLN